MMSDVGVPSPQPRLAGLATAWPTLSPGQSRVMVAELNS